MTVEFDLTDLRNLSADLGAAVTASPDHLRAAVQINALKVKDAWNKKLAGVGGHANRTGNAITYDTEITNDSITADIGAVRGSGRQAGVVRLLENGSVKNPARGYGAASLIENQDDLEQGVQKAIDIALGKAGL